MSPISNPVPVSPVHPRQHHQSQSPLGDHPPPPRGYTYQPVSYQGAGGWDPYSGNYVQGDIFPLGPGGNYYPHREVGASPGPPEPLEGSVGAYYKESENDQASKKRRKTVDDDPDYQPPGSRRVGPPPFNCALIAN